jgi:hypothetical protein
MRRKVDFIWTIGDWRWEASHYEGNGIFYGKVTSPYTPTGEYGTWYIWEIESQGAKLVRGNPQELQEMISKARNAIEMQKAVMLKRVV